MYSAEIILKLTKKARKLREKWLSIRTIAEKIKVSKDSVNKWINKTEEEIKNYKEKRWYKKWNYRKYNEEIKNRIIEIYNNMIKEQKFFINKNTIYENYKKIYNLEENKENNKEENNIEINIEINISYVQYTMQKEWLKRKQEKIIKKWWSKYMNYPQETINKIWKIIMGIDFIWPRYIENDNKPYHFLSIRYIRPEKYWNIEIIEWETTKETIDKLIKLWENNPIPNVLKIDNDTAYWMLKSSKTKNCIWTFTKFLLYLWINPLYSATRSPWNNWNVEWQNSIFNKLFWNEIFINNWNHLKVEITRFNTEYKEYSNLIEEDKEKLKKVWVVYKYIKDLFEEKEKEKEKEKEIKLEINKIEDLKNIENIENLNNLKKENFKANEIYILRKVERIWTKWWEDEIWIVEVLWNKIEIKKEYINLILMCIIKIKENKLEIWVEKDWVLEIIKSIKFEIKNI